MDLPWKPAYQQSAPPEGETESTLLGYWSLAATVAFTVGVYALEGYLDYRQRAAYQKTTFPKELQTIVSEIDKERAANPKPAPKKGKEDKSDDDESKKKQETDASKPLLPQLQGKFKNAQRYGLDVRNALGFIWTVYNTTHFLFSSLPTLENQLRYDCQLVRHFGVGCILDAWIFALCLG